MHHKIVYS